MQLEEEFIKEQEALIVGKTSFDPSSIKDGIITVDMIALQKYLQQQYDYQHKGDHIVVKIDKKSIKIKLATIIHFMLFYTPGAPEVQLRFTKKQTAHYKILNKVHKIACAAASKYEKLN